MEFVVILPDEEEGTFTETKGSETHHDGGHQDERFHDCLSSSIPAPPFEPDGDVQLTYRVAAANLSSLQEVNFWQSHAPTPAHSTLDSSVSAVTCDLPDDDGDKATGTSQQQQLPPLPQQASGNGSTKPTTTTEGSSSMPLIPSFLDRRLRRKAQRKDQGANHPSTTTVSNAASSSSSSSSSSSNRHSGRQSGRFGNSVVVGGAVTPTGKQQEDAHQRVPPNDQNKFSFSRRQSERKARRHETLRDARQQRQQEPSNKVPGDHRANDHQGEEDVVEPLPNPNLRRQSADYDATMMRRAPPLTTLHRASLSRANRLAWQQQQHWQQSRQPQQGPLPVAQPVVVMPPSSPNINHQAQQDPESNHRGVIAEDEVQTSSQNHQKQLYVFVFRFGILVVVVTAALAAGLIASRSRQAPFPRCFTSSEELRDVADRLMLLRRQDGYGPVVYTEIEQFYGPIEEWCVGQIRDFSGLFSVGRNVQMFAFNLNISTWDMSAATNLSQMFENQMEWDKESAWLMVKSRFNQDISEWSVGRVTDMSAMFAGASAFNQNIAGWDVSKVENMTSMFMLASSFNQPLARWNVSCVQNMSSMFSFAWSMNQSLCPWGELMPKNANVTFAFAPSFCPHWVTNLSSNPPGPFCHPCDHS